MASAHSLKSTYLLASVRYEAAAAILSLLGWNPFIFFCLADFTAFAVKNDERQVARSKWHGESFEVFMDLFVLRVVGHSLCAVLAIPLNEIK